MAVDLDAIYQNAQIPSGSQGSGVDLDAIYESSRRSDTSSSGADKGSFGQDMYHIAKEEAPLPLSLKQNIMLSFMPDDAKLRYLAKEFAGARVSTDDEGRISVNGAPINPKGMDIRDISQNTGYSINFLGQVLGALGGAAVAAPAAIGTGGAATPAMVASGMAGGVAGNVAGDAVRTSIGRVFGAPTTGMEQLSNLPEEAAIAAIGETVGLGLNMMTKPMVKATANAWKHGIKLSKKSAPQVLEFVGGVSPDATETILRHGVDKAVNDTTLNPGRTPQIVKRVLLGNENIPEEVLFSKKKGAYDLENGKMAFARSIKDVNDDFYDDLIKAHSKLPQEALDTIKKYPMSAIEAPRNFDPGAPFTLANKILQKAENSLDELGRAINKTEEEALTGKGTYPFHVSDLHAKIKQLISDTGLVGGQKVKGMAPIAPPRNIPGVSDLKEIQHMLESTVVRKGTPETGKIRPIGYIGKAGHVGENLNLRQARTLSKRVDLVVDKIARNKSVSPQIKSAAFDFAKQFRERYQTILGLTDEKAAYSEMKQILFDSHLDRVNAVNTLKNRISSYSMTPPVERQALDTFLSKLDPAGGLVKDIELSNLGKQLADLDMRGTMQSFESVLNSPEFISQSSDSIKEKFYRAIDRSLKDSAPSRMFIDDAEMSLAAKELLDRRANVMRVNTVGSMINKMALGGIGATIGGAAGGPIGSAIGIGSAMALTSKSGTKAMLKLAEKLDQPGKAVVQSGAKKSLSGLLDKTQASILSSGVRGSSEKED